MKNITKYISVLAVVSVFSTSCLEIQPETAIPVEDAIQTVNDLNQAVLGIYAGFKSSSLYSGDLTLMPDIQADLVYGVSGNSNTYGNAWRWETLPNDKSIEGVYASLYMIIGRANFVLESIPGVKEGITDNAVLDTIDELEAEAVFARALAYSELVKCFCKAYDPETAGSEPGVVLISSYFNPEEKKRATLKDSYEFILKDLARAEELFYEETPSQLNYDYFSDAAVYALSARVYLYMQDWENAVKYSTKVIEDSRLRLSSVRLAGLNNYSEYLTMWAYDQSPEIIWRVKFTMSSYGGALGRVLLGYNFISFTPDYVPAKWVIDSFDSNDRRYASCFSTQTTNYAHRLTWPLCVKFLGNQSFLGNRVPHVSMPKVFRLAEQYLIRSEAYCRLGKFSEASKDLTTLREKRYSTGGSVNLSSSNWFDFIEKERVKELYMEGFRLNDLKRWGKGFERKEQLHTIPEGNTMKIDADNPLFVWPIPQHELESPDSEIEPNESNS